MKVLSVQYFLKKYWSAQKCSFKEDDHLPKEVDLELQGS